MLDAVTQRCSELHKIGADQGYTGDLGVDVQQQHEITRKIVAKLADQRGFVVQPRRWVVKRTFAWLGRYRRLSKD